MINTLLLFLCVLLILFPIPPIGREYAHEYSYIGLKSGHSTSLDQYHIKVDEYNDLPPKAERKRLDDFALALKSDPQSVGYVLAYGRRRSCFGEAKARADRAKHYLLGRHSFAADRVVAMDGGYREGLTVDLWIGFKGGPPLTAQPTVDEKDVQLIGDCKPRGALGPAPNNGINRTRK